MAKYRPIQIRIWKDPDFEKYNSSMKLIFLYLCTNELTTESGIYAISTRTISQETRIPEKTVIKLLSNGLKNIIYDFDNNCVFVKNFLKYNGGGRPELLRKSISNNYEEFKTPLWNEFIKLYPEFSNGLQTVDKPFNRISISNRISNRISNSNSNNKDTGKIKYLDFVYLTKEEYKKLEEKLGKSKTKYYIEKLNYYIGSKGKKYKSHYFTILNWSTNEIKEGRDYPTAKIDTSPKEKRSLKTTIEVYKTLAKVNPKYRDKLKKIKKEQQK